MHFTWLQYIDSGVGLSSGDDDRDENIIKDQNHGTQITKHFLFDDFKSMVKIYYSYNRNFFICDSLSTIQIMSFSTGKYFGTFEARGN